MIVRVVSAANKHETLLKLVEKNLIYEDIFGDFFVEFETSDCWTEFIFKVGPIIALPPGKHYNFPECSVFTIVVKDDV